MAGDAEPGPLTRRVFDFVDVMEHLAPGAEAPDDWRPLAEFVAVERFERLGTFLEVQDWRQYTEMLSQWASTIDRFETTLRRVTESGRLVYYEVEERHFRHDNVNVVNSMTVFAFDDSGKIQHLDVYLQQAR
ncbi:MAG TPA: hypothetical protein VEP49_12690 [Acidimicrobiia bacterium]|nr:hypothetical protein [Acidimicrobiia bacterium]